MTVLVLGAGGLLGSTIYPGLLAHGFTAVSHGRDGEAQFQADLTDPDVTRDLIRQVSPGTVLNLVGLTNVDACETNPYQAFLANVRTVENIVNGIRLEESSCHLIHVSTDQVYDGEGDQDETEVALRNYYAFSKYAGELAATTTCSTIIRTNFFGRSRCTTRSSFTDWIFQALSKGESIQVFDDVQFSAISMQSLGKIMSLVIREAPGGIFNVGSHGGMSKADFAFAFAEEVGLPTKLLHRVSIDECTFFRARRPRNMRMSCSKFETAVGARLPMLEDEVRHAASEYR